MSFLRGLLTEDVISDEQFDTILRNIPTVASEMAKDQKALNLGDVKLEDFKIKYGHLRPSSYDITSPNYADLIEDGIYSLSSDFEVSQHFPDIELGTYGEAVAYQLIY